MRQPLIINVRGNSGSGKTHLTREFMKLCKPMKLTEPISDQDQFLTYKGQPWVVLGRYETACGGCDTIKTQCEIVRRVEAYHRMHANIWLEGLLMSGMYGAVGACSELFADTWVFAFLDTPLNKCLQRIRQRHKAAGNLKPLNETNTRVRHMTIQRTQERITAMGRRVVVLDHTKALEQLLKIIKKEG